MSAVARKINVGPAAARRHGRCSEAFLPTSVANADTEPLHQLPWLPGRIGPV